MSDFGSPEHTLRSWLGNDVPVYEEVCRIAAKEVRHDVRVRAIKRLAAEVLYGTSGTATYRHLYRKAYGKDHRLSWTDVLGVLDGVRDAMTRAEFDAVDWDELTEDVMDVTDAGRSAQ
jgi:hypothetical protein